MEEDIKNYSPTVMFRGTTCMIKRNPLNNTKIDIIYAHFVKCNLLLHFAIKAELLFRNFQREAIFFFDKCALLKILFVHLYD